MGPDFSNHQAPLHSMETTPRADVLVIGGGMYGCWISSLLANDGLSVVLMEQADGLLTRASYANQARVHNGYHYPRSLLTGMRSHVNFTRFCKEFADCIDDSFQMLYVVARTHSKVTARQFERFCQTIEAPLAPASAHWRAAFNPALVEAVYNAEEHAFDAVKLRGRMQERLDAARVDVRTETQVTRMTRGEDGAITANWQHVRHPAPEGTGQLTVRWVFNCTYSSINHVLALGGRPAVPLKHELTEMALMDVPPELRQIGVTVMCGPFFSCMPFPARGLHTLSHVRYTPHGAWHERDGTVFDATGGVDAFVRHTQQAAMLRDAVRYMPLLAQSRYVESLWEIKTVLPQNEGDDGRPILWKVEPGWASATGGLVSVMGGKIDNVYDVEREVFSLTRAPLPPSHREAP